MPFAQLEHYCPPVIMAVLDAGEAILGIYESGEDVEVEYKADQSPLTAADRASHALLMERLQQLWDLPVLSEESREVPWERRGQWESYWLVDPLDGTKEFIRRNGEFTVNVALVSRGVPVYGVVYAPVPGLLYFGAAGHGARRAVRGVDYADRDGLAARLTDAERAFPSLPLAQEAGRPFTVVASRSHGNVETTDFIERLEADHGPARRVSVGSSLKLCLCAEGTADVYPRLAPTMHWDTAAAQAIVAAAGGQVTQYGTEDELAYGGPSLVNPYFVVTRPGFRI